MGKHFSSSCQYPGCPKASLYGQMFSHNGISDFIPVCGEHDKKLGIEHLAKAFGLSLDSAEKMNKLMNIEGRVEKQP